MVTNDCATDKRLLSSYLRKASTHRRYKMNLPFAALEVHARLSFFTTFLGQNRANPKTDDVGGRYTLSATAAASFRVCCVIAVLSASAATSDAFGSIGVPASLVAVQGTSNSRSGVTATVAQNGTGGTPQVSAFYCATQTPPLGAGTDICTVKLSAASTTGPVAVALTSSNASVAVPASVTISENAASARFTATISPVLASQTATLTAGAGSSSINYVIKLSAATRGLSLDATSLNFQDVSLNSPAFQPVTLTSTGTEPVTVSASSLNGNGFSISGIAFPLTLSPNQSTTLNVKFAPTTSGPFTGTLSFTSNSTSSTTATVTLSGTGGKPQLSALYCATQTPVGGGGTDICTVKMNSGSGNGPLTVTLSSSNASVVVPASITIPESSASAQFTATIKSVLASQTATLTASLGSSSSKYMIELSAGTRGLSASRTSVSFPGITVKTSVMQGVTVASTGTMPVTLSGVTVTNGAFTVSGIGFPLTLNPGQSAGLTVQFSPSVVGTIAGQLTLNTNSSNGPISIVLSGSAIAVPSDGSAPQGFFPYAGSPLVASMEAANPTTPISKNLFGMTIADLTAPWGDPQSSATPFPSLPVSTFRFWDVTPWSRMEPQQGQFVWIFMDSVLAINQKGGVSDFIYTFGRTPQWASTSPNDPCTNGEGAGTCTFPNMDAFDNFATQLVQRYCGKVKYYEPWNEPDGPAFWDGTNAQLLTISQHVSQIVKDPANCGCTNGSCSPNGGANPNKVLLPPISELSPESIGWLDAFLATAGAPYPYADVVAFHGYLWSGYQPEQTLSQLPVYKQTLAKYGMANLELWDTEVSWKSNTNLAVSSQAAWTMRYHIAEALAGISRAVWYAYDRCGWGTLWTSPLCETNGEPVGQITPPGVAYGTIAKWLTGANITHCQQYEDGLWACELQRANGYDAWILWNASGNTSSVPVSASLGLTTYRDWQNNSTALPTEIIVTNTPVLLEP